MPEVDALVIGAGPAGLMAAQMLTEAGRQVHIVEAKPSPARKFLMAGKSGLNLSKDEELETFLDNYGEATEFLRPMISAFDPAAVQAWANNLGQEVFTGSSGRLFPVSMKASPLLRAWLAKLDSSGATLYKKWRWIGFDTDGYRFDTPQGEKQLKPSVTVLALGGASWQKLGSDGQWSELLKSKSVTTTAFTAANAGLKVDWSPYMQKHFGSAVKSTRLSAGSINTRGEFVISAEGLEGSGIYSVSKAVREGHGLTVDLYPDSTLEVLQKKLQRARGKESLSNFLRKSILLKGARLALLQEFSKPLPPLNELAPLLKSLAIKTTGLADMEHAISTAGGVALDAVDESLMLKNLPGVFCAGEMLDWEAPTGGYLITACLATGRWAGIAAAAYQES